MQLHDLNVNEAIRAMARLDQRNYKLKRGVGVYDEIRCENGKFFIKERLSRDFCETNTLPMAWLIGDNWTLEAL